MIRMLPDGMVNEALLEATPFTMGSFEDAMYEHRGDEITRRIQLAKEALARKELYGPDNGGQKDLKDEEGSGVGEDVEQTPSSITLVSEHAAAGELESAAEESIEKPAEESIEEPTEVSSEEPKEEEPPPSVTPAKRNMSSSDDSDAGNGKPDMQRMKAEHGAAIRTKTTRSNRWGATHNSSGKEEPNSSSMADALGIAKGLTADRRQSTSRREVSNNLRGTHDPVLGFGTRDHQKDGGKIRSLESIRKDIFRSADALRFPKGQESLAFHRGNFVDQNAVVRSANAYADFIIEDACQRGIPENQRRIIREMDGRNDQGIPANEIKQSVTGHFVVNASYAHMANQTDEDLKEIQEELEAVMVNLQRDPTRMTQFRGWSSRNAERSKEARERCFHWSAPGTPQLPRLPYSDKLHRLSAKLENFLQIGGRLHDDCVARNYIPPGFAYQILSTGKTN